MNSQLLQILKQVFWRAHETRPSRRLRNNSMRRRSYLTLPDHSFRPQPNLQQSSIPHQIQSSDTIPSPDHPLYTRLLVKCLNHCKKIQSRRLFDEMPQRVITASRVIKLVHAQSSILGFASKGRLGNAIVDLYAKCGNMDFAWKAIERLERRDTLSWNSVLSMYSRGGMLEHVVQLFGSMMNCGVFPNQFSYAVVLSVCGRLDDVVLGKVVHCHIIKMGFGFDSFCVGALIDMYAKCRCVVDARLIFDGAVNLDTVSWTAMISGYIQSGFADKGLRLFEDMLKAGLLPDQVAFVTVISACMELGLLGDGRRLFSQMHNPNVVSWNVMISGHAKKGYEVEAIEYFHNMTNAGVKPTRSTLGSVLSTIASLSNLEYGLQVHSLATKLGLDCNVYVGSSLINMYSKCQRVEAARNVFDALDEKNIVLWNAMLGGYAQNRYAGDVIDLFVKMKDSGFEPDDFSYTSILSASACFKSIEMGRQLHSVIIKNKLESNLFVGNALVDMYAKSGSLQYARKQFEMITNRDNVSWNAIIVGYAQEEEEDEAFNMFRRMRSHGIEPDEVSLASILSACAKMEFLDRGKELHCFLIKYGLVTGLYSGSSLVDMYAKCGAVGDAHKIFWCLPEKSVVCRNALIAGYARINLDVAVNLFKDIMSAGLYPSEVTFAILFDACDEPSKMSLGRQFHSLVLKRYLPYDDEFLALSLLGMYFNCQEQADAKVVFSELPNPKSRVLWTATISGHTQNDCSDEALLVYRDMRSYNAMPDQATFVSVLKACAALASLQDGMEIHSLTFHTGFDSDELTCSAIVDMYAKCGEVKNSFKVFEEIVGKKDVITWNSMIVGFAKNGYAENALKIFEEMSCTNIKPDEVTFLGLLTACSHAGKVSQGQQIFSSMTNYYGIQPRLDHYACMIDLLGRWGYLKEAEEFLEKLEVEPDPMVWASFLGACRLHGDERRGQHAAEILIRLKPQSSSSYVLLSNIFAASGNWEGVNSMRREMKEKGVKKFPGCSWIVVEQSTHLFLVGDKGHSCSGEIYAVLKDLYATMEVVDFGPESELESNTTSFFCHQKELLSRDQHFAGALADQDILRG